MKVHVLPGRVLPGEPKTMMLNRIVLGLAHHWLLVLNVLMGSFVALPWLAPILMAADQTGPARAICLFYSTQCHQLPQRSYFLFGPQASYVLAEIQAAWVATDNPLILRQFIGNGEMGWKVAWSDRMVSMYTTVFLAGLLYGMLRRRPRPLPLWAFCLFVLPLALDGATHMFSDLSGLGNGFGDSNGWLAWLTGYRFPVTFYAGDQLGSFNSWMRLGSGVCFGIGIVGLAYPYLAQFADETRVHASLRQQGVESLPN